MARTYKYLFPQVAGLANLILAYRRARRGKRSRDYVFAFDQMREENLVALRDSLADGTYRPGAYHNFYISEPKRRLISAAPFVDRIVHHAIVNVIEPIFEREFVPDSYACRVGKGTHRALARCRHFVRRYRYYLKGDVVKFFPSIDHEILTRLVRKRIADERLMALIALILRSGKDVLSGERPRVYFPGDDLFSVLRPAGLPIGNLTSQFLANVYLNPMDHWVKEELRVKGYVRYADDFVLFSDDKAALWRRRKQIAAKLSEFRLRLHPDKTIVSKTSCGVKFLGFKVCPYHTRLLRDSVKRFRRKLKALSEQYASGEVDATRVRQSVESWIAHASYAKSLGLRKQLLWSVRFKRDPRHRDAKPLVREDPRFPDVVVPYDCEVPQKPAPQLHAGP